MTDVIVFHHALGLTPGVHAFADDLRADGHRVVMPDLYDGARFGSLEAGVAHAEAIGVDAIMARGMAAAEAVPHDAVYIGFSLGVLPAQRLAQTRAGARGAVLAHACVPLGYFGPWPRGVPAQLHVMARDARGDVDEARALAAEVESAELFLYPGDRHLFTDRSLADHDPQAAALFTGRVRAFLESLGRRPRR